MVMRHTAEMRSQLHDPERVDGRHRAREELGGLDDFTGHNPLGLVGLLGLGRLASISLAGLFWLLAPFEKGRTRKEG